MQKAEFTKKHGPIQINEAVDSYFSRLRQPHFEQGKWHTVRHQGAKILNGHFYTIGYFGQNYNPETLAHNWEALDYGLTFTSGLVKILRDGECYALQSEGDGLYFPFIFGSCTVEGLPDFAQMQALLPEPLLRAYQTGEIKETYDATIQVYNTSKRACLFWDDESEEDYMEDLETRTYEAYQTTSKQMRSSLEKVVEIVFYADFVEFPVIYGGRDKYGQFLGVITSCVWT